MNVQGCNCSIVIKTAYREIDVPYSEETLREAVSILQEEAAIEGDGVCKAIQRVNGVTGCVVTPLTIGTAPFLLYLAMGSAGHPVFVSETRNLYRHFLDLLPLEDCPRFDLVQERGDGKRLYEACGVKGFELRIHREETIKLKLDICSERPPVTYPYNKTEKPESEERFNGDHVTYKINGNDFKNIYGLVLTSQKEEGTKTEIWIKRNLAYGKELPDLINEIIVTAQLYRDEYEKRHFGMFRITLTGLVLSSDETNVNSVGAVIGPLRYYVAGTMKAEVFSFGEGRLE